MDISKITSSVPIDISQLENMLKIDNSMQVIIHYITQNIFPNSLIQDQIELNFDELRESFIDEGIEIIKKLSLILDKYITKYPTQYVNIDLDNQWFKGEEPFIKESSSQNLFANKKKISEILAIICKLVDFINVNFLSELDLYDKKISYLSRQPQNIHILIMTNQITSIQTECKKKFKAFHSTCNIIHTYILSIYETNEHGFLAYMPKITLNIFSSSLYFLQDDIDFLSFIVKFNSWIDSEIRCNYIIKIMNLNELIHSGDYPNLIRILARFNPDISLLIEDIIFLYKKYLKDESIIQDIILIIHLINLSIPKNFSLSLDYDTLIYFVSVQLSVISKIKSIKDRIPEDKYDIIILQCFNCIKYIVNINNDIFNSYLIYYTINISLDFYDDGNEDLIVVLNDIFFILIKNKLSIIYLCSIKDELYLSNIKIPLSMGNRAKITEWTTIYSKISSYEFYDEFIDQLTSCIIVKPCFIPMNEDGTMIQVCDEYMLSSYLWTTPINPFTRMSLTINELKEFNKNEQCLQEKHKFMQKLKDGIKFSK